MKKKAGKSQRIVHPLDAALGVRIKALREETEPRTTQGWLARAIGVTTPQIQKYESGINRVGFSRLCEIADALGVAADMLIRPVIRARRR